MSTPLVQSQENFPLKTSLRHTNDNVWDLLSEIKILHMVFEYILEISVHLFLINYSTQSSILSGY